MIGQQVRDKPATLRDGALDAQLQAPDRLGRGVAGLDASSAFMPILLDALERYPARLAEPSA